MNIGIPDHIPFFTIFCSLNRLVLPIGCLCSESIYSHATLLGFNIEPLCTTLLQNAMNMLALGQRMNNENGQYNNNLKKK